MTPCIEAPGCRSSAGYGVVTIAGRQYKAHRVAYCRHFGLEMNAITDVVVRHKCDNRGCINPDHLETGTHKDNAADRQARGRGAYQRNPQFKPNRVLTDEQINWVRANYIPRHKELGQRAMARKLGVSQAILSLTLLGQRNCK